MIVLEEGPSKLAAAFFTSRASTSILDPPPYASTTNLLTDPEVVSAQLTTKKERKRRRRRRRIIIILCSFVTYTVILTAVLIKKPWRKRFRAGPPPQPPLWDPLPSSNPMNTSVDAALGAYPIICDSWDNTSSEISRLHYSFPLNSTGLFFENSATNLAGGSFHMWSDPSITNGYLMEIAVRSRYNPDSDGIHVCVMQGAQPDEYGLFISDALDEIGYPLEADVNLRVPVGAVLGSLSTYLPRFAQIIGLPNGVPPLTLDSVSLDGPVSTVVMNSGEIRNLAIQTTAAFRGSVTVTQSLSLISQSSLISANITLLYRGHPFEIVLNTVAAPINALVRATNLDRKGANAAIPINITAITNYAPLTLAVNYSYSQPPVLLSVNAQTERAPLHLQLPPSFEGTFNLSAQGSQASTWPSEVADPLNQKRTRLVDCFDSADATNVKGQIKWNTSSRRQMRRGNSSPLRATGSIQGSTTLAKAILDLSDPKKLFSQSKFWPNGSIVNYPT